MAATFTAHGGGSRREEEYGNPSKTQVREKDQSGWRAEVRSMRENGETDENGMLRSVDL